MILRYNFAGATLMKVTLDGYRTERMLSLTATSAVALYVDVLEEVLQLLFVVLLLGEDALGNVAGGEVLAVGKLCYRLVAGDGATLRAYVLLQEASHLVVAVGLVVGARGVFKPLLRVEQGCAFELDDALGQQACVLKLLESVLLKFALYVAAHCASHNGSTHPILVERQPLLGQRLVEHEQHFLHVDFLFDDIYTFFCHSIVFLGVIP